MLSPEMSCTHVLRIVGLPLAIACLPHDLRFVSLVTLSRRQSTLVFLACTWTTLHSWLLYARSSHPVLLSTVTLAQMRRPAHTDLLNVPLFLHIRIPTLLIACYACYHYTSQATHTARMSADTSYSRNVLALHLSLVTCLPSTFFCLHHSIAHPAVQLCAFPSEHLARSILTAYMSSIRSLY